ncbi:MAG TPA: zinc metalloprotease HtpX [Actinomycetota bacterium]|jgi:heat shock protein HtpX
MQPGINKAKTWILIAALGGLFVLVGGWIGKGPGAVTALAFALVFNFSMYWFSDKIAIATTKSKPVTEAEMPAYYKIVRELAQERGIPMPKLYVSEMMQPNAFATGRNPEHASVSVTRGILQILDERELRGVLAHELSHVVNRDILISSVAAAIGMSITFLARFAFFFGGSDDNRGGNGLALLVAWILAPLAAAIIQMAVSRSREYQADESGAYLSHDPEALASALRKLDQASKQIPVPATVSPATAHLFIVNPMASLRGKGGITNLFSTHPPTEQRIARLEAIKQQMTSGGNPFPQGQSPFG